MKDRTSTVEVPERWLKFERTEQKLSMQFSLSNIFENQSKIIGRKSYMCLFVYGLLKSEDLPTARSIIRVASSIGGGGLWLLTHALCVKI